MEVDFVLGDRVAIEVKAKERVSDHDLKGIRALSEELKPPKKILVSLEKMPRTTEDQIEIIPVTSFLDLLWEGGLMEKLP